MSRLKSSYFLYSVVFLLTVSFSASSAQSETVQTPQQAVEQFLGDIRLMEFPARDADRQNQLIGEANAYLDLESMGKRALVDHWAEATPEDRKIFFDLMWQLIENIAYPNSNRFIGNYKITYPEVLPSGNGFEVQSIVQQQAEGLEARVVYHLYQKDEQWKIDDVVLDDVSIAEDLKYQFDKIIADSGFPGLLDKMREKLAQAEKENVRSAG